MAVLPAKESIEEEFQTNLLEYIRREWGDVLGEHVDLLSHEDGLEKIATMIRSGELRAIEA